MVRDIELLKIIKEEELKVSSSSFLDVLKRNIVIDIIKEAAKNNDVISSKLDSNKKINILISSFIERVSREKRSIITTKEIYSDANMEILTEKLREFLATLSLNIKESDIDGDDKLSKLVEEMSKHTWDMAYEIARIIVSIAVCSIVMEMASEFKESVDKAIMSAINKYGVSTAMLVTLKYANTFKITTYKDWLAIIHIYTGYSGAFIELSDHMSLKFDDMQEHYEDRIEEIENEKNKIEAKFKEYKDKNNKDNKKVLKTDLKIDSIISKLSELDLKTNKLFDNHIKEEKDSIIEITSSIKYSAIEASYKVQLDSIINQISDLKVENKQLRLEKSNLLKEIEAIKIGSAKKEECIEAAVCENATATKPHQAISPFDENTYYGYALVNIKNKKVYAYIPQVQREIEVNYESDNSWLTNGQVVVVREKRIVGYEQVYFDNISAVNTEILSVKNVSGVPLAFNFMGRQVNTSLNPIKLRNSTFIAIDRVDKTWCCMSKKARFIMDNFKDYLEIRGISVFLVTKEISNGYLLENCMTKDIEFYSDLDKVNEGNLVVMKNKDIINVLDNNMFYTLSSYYDRKQLAMYIENEECFVKLNGEKIYIENIATNARNNDVVYLDENDEYLSNLGTEHQEKFKGFKKITATNGLNEKAKTKESVLIFGNLSFRNSYSLTFLKENIKTITVDGFCSKTKLEQAIKKEKPSYIIFDTAYCSHDNMWSIKACKTKYIASQSSGAASMLEQYKEVVKRC